MKKNRIIIATLFFMIARCHGLEAQIGCIDHSKHLDLSDGYDYKNYDYVYCACPCNQYAWSFNRNRCSQCLHFHDPEAFEIVR